MKKEWRGLMESFEKSLKPKDLEFHIENFEVKDPIKDLFRTTQRISDTLILINRNLKFMRKQRDRQVVKLRDELELKKTYNILKVEPKPAPKKPTFRPHIPQQPELKE